MVDTVIREVANGIWTFSRPFARFGFYPMGGRSTAIRLKTGGVWVLASTPLGTETKDTINKLGPVEYIVAADAVHYLFLAEYKKEYPGAKLIAPEEAALQPINKDLKFDGIWGRDPPETRYGYEEEIEDCYFSGFKNKDVAFFHKDSKSLIEADLLLNLPAKEQYSKSKSSPNFLGFGGLNPFSWGYSRVIWQLGTDKEAMRRDAKKVASWDFERIIPCHGDVIESKAKESWNAAYKYFLE